MSKKNSKERYIEDLILMDDIFSILIFEDNASTEEVLQIILNKKDLKVRNNAVQKLFKNLQGRSVIMDVFCEDSAGKTYNIEVQRDDKNADPKRARYHSGLMDMNVLKTSTDFTELPESYVIFITENDVLRKNLPIYHIYRTIRETNERFEDGSHIVYVNASIQEDTELGRLMHDFFCKRAEDMYSKVLANRVKYFKETVEGVKKMGSVIERLREEGFEIGMERGIEKGIRKGIEKGRELSCVDLYKNGFEPETISKGLDISVEDVFEILRKYDVQIRI